MPPGKKATIRQVAATAGVSLQTVSRVLNDHPYVAEKTRQRVLAAIQQLEYRPDAIARSLIKGRSHTLGVVIGKLEYYGPHRLLAGIEQEAIALGYGIALSIVHNSHPDDAEQQLESLLSRKVDGIIWAVPEVDNNQQWVQAKLRASKFPVTFVTGTVAHGFPSVINDNRGGGRLATTHLLDRGYRHIGHISGPHTWFVAQERQLGWQEALTAANRPPQQRHVIEGNWTPQSGERGLYQLLDQYPELDAVFAANDHMALGVLQAAHLLGRHIPEDLAVVGFDATEESAYFWPPLTTVRQHLLATGSAAVQEIHRIIEHEHISNGNGVEMPVMIVPELIVRKSTVPA